MPDLKRNLLLKETFIVLFILFIAFLLRIKDIDFLIPYFGYGPDELGLIETSLHMIKNKDPNPHFFTYGSFYFYLLIIMFLFYFGVSSFISSSTISSLVQTTFYWSNDFVLLYIGRFSSVIFGLATIFLTYKITKFLWNRETGYLSASFVALNPFHIFISQFLKTDSLLIFLILMTLYFCLKILKSGNLSSYFWAGVFSGLAISTKYQFLAFAPILVSHFIFSSNNSIPPPNRLNHRFAFIKITFSNNLIFSFYCMILTFFISSPFFFIDIFTSAKFVINLLFADKEVNVFFIKPDSFIYNKVWYQILILFPYIFSPFLYLCGILAVPSIWKKCKLKLFLIISFPLLYFIPTSILSGVVSFQYYIPLVPYISILSSYFIVLYLKSNNLNKIISGYIIITFTLFWFGWNIFSHPFHSLLKLYENAAHWAVSHISKNESIIYHTWILEPTVLFHYPLGYKYCYRSLPTENDLNNIQPDWLFLTHSSFFSDQRWSKDNIIFDQFYRRLKNGNHPNYVYFKEFQTSNTSQILFELAYPDFKDFIISIFKKRD